MLGDFCFPAEKDRIVARVWMTGKRGHLAIHLWTLCLTCSSNSFSSIHWLWLAESQRWNRQLWKLIKTVGGKSLGTIFDWSFSSQASLPALPASLPISLGKRGHLAIHLWTLCLTCSSNSFSSIHWLWLAESQRWNRQLWKLIKTVGGKSLGMDI